MEAGALEILKKYWKHDRFREPQQQVIESVLAGNDTFALMPTGGGKSVCFQIPALLKPGICLVISPLVALMRDQVANLQGRGIKAIALTGGIAAEEMIDLLDNCQFGNYKFLYLSPERLQSDWITERIKNLPVNLIAIDEAHCVSQWGHDFRPAYLKIAALREHFPKVPFLALTASATKRVQDDIVAQLHLENVRLFKKSFDRENLAYMVFETEDKLRMIRQILTKNPQPSIIYVRNRKSCIEVSSQLRSLGFTATFYHGGLSTREKDAHMQLWMSEKATVMVATNAFGMGIDKPNVKTVIHIQLPENLENYYQEAGRAGRNDGKAFAVLLSAPSDLIQAKNQFIAVLPDKHFLSTVYLKLCSYFQIAYGEGINEQFPFNLNHFCQQYGFPVMKAYNAIQFLDRQGILSLSQEFSEKIVVRFLIESREVIRYMSLNPADEPVMLAILRTYPGIYDIPCAINTALLAKKSGNPESTILNLLQKLSERQIVSYQSSSNDTILQFNEVREDQHTINRVSKYLQSQNELKTRQLQAVTEYVSNDKACKSKLLLAYFGETRKADCGICSFCISRPRQKNNTVSLANQIVELLQQTDLDSREIQDRVGHPKEAVIFALQQLLENNAIAIGSNNKYTLK